MVVVRTCKLLKTTYGIQLHNNLHFDLEILTALNHAASLGTNLLICAGILPFYVIPRAYTYSKKVQYCPQIKLNSPPFLFFPCHYAFLVQMGRNNVPIFYLGFTMLVWSINLERTDEVNRLTFALLFWVWIKYIPSCTLTVEVLFRNSTCSINMRSKI